MESLRDALMGVSEDFAVICKGVGLPEDLEGELQGRGKGLD